MPFYGLVLFCITLEENSNEGGVGEGGTEQTFSYVFKK